MRSLARHVGLAILWTASLACSCVDDLVLVNQSSAPVTVRIFPVQGDSTDPNCHCPDGYVHGGYAVASYSDSGKVTLGDWQPLDSTALQHQRTDKDLAIVMSLAPGAALLIGREARTCASGPLGEDIPRAIVVESPTVRRSWGTPTAVRNAFVKSSDGGPYLHVLRR